MHNPEPNEPFETHPAEPSAPLELERLADTSSSDTHDAGASEGAGTTVWKAAASSVPKLRQKPAASPDLGAGAGFQGFTQDALPSRGPATGGERVTRSLEHDDDDVPVNATPLGATPPFWEIWLEHLTSIPRPILIGGAAVAVVCGVAAAFLLPSRGGTSVSLARLRQQPEAFDGQIVHVQGKAGEAFSIGGSYVFSLCQGRDTIVVYSRTRRPAPHQDVQARGTVSIGYLDGVPRVALLEDTSSR